MYNFDKIIHRNHTSNVKYDLRKVYFGSEDVLPMWVADMDFETPEFIRQAVESRAKHPIYGYTFMSEKYYSSIISWLKRRHQWEVEKEWILFSPGIVPALNFAVQAFTDKNEGIIVQPPVYFPFFQAIEIHGRKCLENKLLYRDGRYTIDFENLERLAKHAKMLFLSSPHNPVGRCWSREELSQMADICLRNNVVIISDEIHHDIILPGHTHYPTSTLSEAVSEITVSCIAPSKTFNMAGLSTSSVIIKNEELRDKFKSVLEKAHIQSGNLFGMAASEAAYSEGEEWLSAFTSYLQANYKFLSDAISLEFSSLKMVELEATYLAWIDFRDTKLSDEDIKERLIHQAKLGLSHGPIFGPGGEGFQRINLAAPKSLVAEAVLRLKKVFE